MTARRPAPGRQVSVGSLRVDAARAVMKLRDYQLPEPEMWILELLRAGVTLGADSLRVTGDSDDVRVSWEGRAPQLDDLTTLLDELVNPVADPARRHLRLMATAINTALGLRPRYVDIYVVADAGTKRVRYTPSILEVDEDDPLAGASKLRHLVAEDVAKPLAAPAKGVLVHLRRFPDLGVLTTFVSGREPPELRLVRESCDDTRVPIAIGDGVLERARSDRDVLRIPLGPDIDGFMALMHAATRPDWARPAIFEACERGVLLARHPIELGISVYQAVPIRVSVDADRLPTNASRSEVRRDDAPIAQAEARASEVFAELVEKIAGELGPEPTLEWSAHGRAELERSAFALLASAVGVTDFRAHVGGLVSGPLAPLLELPLLRDAFGNPRTLSEVAAAAHHSAFVYRGEEPLDERLAEWLFDLIWVRPGDAVEILLAHTELEDVAPRIATAERSRLARLRYLRYPVHEGVVREAEGQLLSIPLADLPERVTDGSALSPHFFTMPALEGELCLTSSGAHATVSYLYDGRLLAKRRIESRVPFEAVVWSPLLTPNETFSALRDDEGAAAVDSALIGAAIWAAELLASRLAGDTTTEGEPRQRWVRSAKKLAASKEVRAALRGAIYAHHQLFDRRDFPGPLRSAEVFPALTTDGEARWASLETIAKSAEHGTYFTADASAASRACPGLPPKRLVIAGGTDDRAYLRALLPEPASFVHYDRGELSVARDGDSLARELATVTGAAMSFDRDAGFGAIGMTVTVPIVDIRHCGQTLFKGNEIDTRFPAWVLYEGTALVPDEQWQSVTGGFVPALFSVEESMLMRRCAAHLVGNDAPGLFVADEIFERQVVPMLLERLGEVGLETVLPRALRQSLRALPLFFVLGLEAAHSLDEIEKLHPGTLRYVAPDRAADFELDGFHPLRAPERLARAVAAMLGKQARNADKELERRRKKALRSARLEVHRERPKIEIPPSADDARAVDVEPSSPLVRKLRVGLTMESSSLEILIEDRSFSSKTWIGGPPVAATVRATAMAADEDFVEVSDKAREAIEAMVIEQVPSLLAGLAARDPDALRVDHAARRLLDWWIDHPVEDGPGARRIAKALETLGEAPLFDSVQGDRVGARAALRRSKVYVATYVGMWLGPDDGEAPHSLDRPVLRVAEGQERRRQLALISAITGCDVADVTKACEQLQSRRRVAQGLVPKPTLHGVEDASHVHDVSTLVGKDRRLRAALGPGEIGLSDSGSSRVYIRRGGRALDVVSVSVFPAIVATLESPDVPRDPTKIAGHAPLAERLQQLTALLVRRLVEDGVALLTTEEKRRIRSAMLDGRVLAGDEEGDALPLFETTEGIWLTKDAIREQSERFGVVWYVTDFGCAEVPLDPERHAFRLSGDEATNLLGELLILTDATEELRQDAEARRNRNRRPVESLTLEYGEDSAAMAWEILKAKGEHRIEGVVAPLRPGLDAHRGMRLSRERHPLGEHRDPCEWPTRAVVDAPQVEPNRTWSGALEEGDAFETLKREVRRASERALSSLVKIPHDALEPRRVSVADARRAGVEIPVRGALWARSGGVPPEPVTVVDRGGSRVLRGAGSASLPIEGRLFVDGLPHVDAAERVAKVVYTRMLSSLSRRVANEWDPVKAAHIVQGIAAKLVKAEDLPGEHEWPLGVGRPIRSRHRGAVAHGEGGHRLVRQPRAGGGGARHLRVERRGADRGGSLAHRRWIARGAGHPDAPRLARATVAARGEVRADAGACDEGADCRGRRGRRRHGRLRVAGGQLRRGGRDANSRFHRTADGTETAFAGRGTGGIRSPLRDEGEGLGVGDPEPAASDPPARRRRELRAHEPQSGGAGSPERHGFGRPTGGRRDCHPRRAGGGRGQSRAGRRDGRA